MNDELNAQLLRTAERLRIVSVAQLERGDRIQNARDLITSMATYVRPEANVPALAINALGDQLAVVGKEFAATASHEDAVAMIEKLREFRLSL